MLARPADLSAIAGLSCYELRWIEQHFEIPVPSNFLMLVHCDNAVTYLLNRSNSVN